MPLIITIKTPKIPVKKKKVIAMITMNITIHQNVSFKHYNLMKMCHLNNFILFKLLSINITPRYTNTKPSLSDHYRIPIGNSQYFTFTKYLLQHETQNISILLVDKHWFSITGFIQMQQARTNWKYNKPWYSTYQCQLHIRYVHCEYNFVTRPFITGMWPIWITYWKHTLKRKKKNVHNGTL